MVRRILAVWSLMMLFVAGCGGDPLGRVPVTGKVTLADGVKTDQYEVRKVTLVPVDPTQGTRQATANILEDGSFVMSTRMPDDGVVPGSYKVSNNFTHYPPIPADYAVKWEFEPATVEVTSGMDPLSITIRQVK